MYLGTKPLSLFVFVNDVIHYAVFLGLLRVHDEITLHVFLNLVELLAGMFGEDLVGDLAHAQDFTGMDIDVSGLAAQPAHRGLVNQNARARQGIALTRYTGAEKKRAHAGRLANA